MKASLILAHNWKNQNPVGYWMSEKLDGFRAYWDGKQFKSREGNVFHAPAWFTAGLPNIPLDGELWAGRGNFSKVASAAKSKKGDWTGIIYVVFDLPTSQLPFEARQAALNALPPLPQLLVLEQELVESAEQVQAELARVEALGGEGLMLRAPKSMYEPRRSYTLLKVKTFHDAEATVIGYEAGEGRNASAMGALKVVAPNGVEFKVGTGFSDAERSNPPAIGTLITYKYKEILKSGKPLFTSFLRVAA